MPERVDPEFREVFLTKPGVRSAMRARAGGERGEGVQASVLVRSFQWGPESYAYGSEREWMVGARVERDRGERCLRRLCRELLPRGEVRLDELP